VVVDNEAARENVARYAGNQGAAVSVEKVGESRWELTLTKGFSCGVPAAVATGGADMPVAVLFLSDRMGASPELGVVLIRVFIGTLVKASSPPKRLLFMNSGVNLTTQGSPVLEELAQLASQGAEILSCGTCLDFLGKKEALRIGAVTNMFDTVETLTRTHRVVTIS